MKRKNCVHEGENVPMKDKSKGLQLKLLGVPYEQGWKIRNKATCAHEGKNEFMKGQVRIFV